MALVENSVSEIGQREADNSSNPPPPPSAVENSAAEIGQREANNSSNPALSPRKRTKDPGVRVRNGRIYDSENGKTCHQVFLNLFRSCMDLIS